MAAVPTVSSSFAGDVPLLILESFAAELGLAAQAAVQTAVMEAPAVF
jgi:hypothetical protein